MAGQNIHRYEYRFENAIPIESPRAPTGADVSAGEMICVVEPGDNLNNFRQSRGRINSFAEGIAR